MKIRDMSKCLEEFEQLCRAFLKSKNIVDKEGVPPFYIRLLADLEDYLNQVSSPELNPYWYYSVALCVFTLFNTIPHTAFLQSNRNT